jgi:AhpD family alkylhydroperoxidase
MAKNWLDMVTELSAEVKVLRAGAPDVMKEFSAMARAASGPEALDSKTKELIALAISIAVRRDPCIAFHAQAAVKQLASRDEVRGDGNGDLYGYRTLGRVCLTSYRSLRPV